MKNEGYCFVGSIGNAEIDENEYDKEEFIGETAKRLDEAADNILEKNGKYFSIYGIPVIVSDIRLFENPRYEIYVEEDDEIDPKRFVSISVSFEYLGCYQGYKSYLFDSEKDNIDTFNILKDIVAENLTEISNIPLSKSDGIIEITKEDYDKLLEDFTNMFFDEIMKANLHVGDIYVDDNDSSNCSYVGFPIGLYRLERIIVGNKKLLKTYVIVMSKFNCLTGLFEDPRSYSFAEFYPDLMEGRSYKTVEEVFDYYLN